MSKLTKAAVTIGALWFLAMFRLMWVALTHKVRLCLGAYDCAYGHGPSMDDPWSVGEFLQHALPVTVVALIVLGFAWLWLHEPEPKPGLKD